LELDWLEEILKAVCSGTVDIGVLVEGLADSASRNKPADCTGVGLDLTRLAQGSLEYGVGAAAARPEARRAADRLREGNEKLAADGTLAAVYFRWFLYSSTESVIIDEINDARRRQRLLTGGIAGSLLLLLVMMIQMRRVLVSSRTAEEARESAERDRAASGDRRNAPAERRAFPPPFRVDGRGLRDLRDDLR
jgi:hypothetical protein